MDNALIIQSMGTGAWIRQPICELWIQLRDLNKQQRTEQLTKIPDVNGLVDSTLCSVQTKDKHSKSQIKIKLKADARYKVTNTWIARRKSYH